MAPALRLSGPVAVQVELPPGDREEGGIVWRKQPPVDAFDQQDELPFVGRLDDQDAARLAWRKPPIVQIIAIHRHERAPQLLREPVVGDVGGTAQLFVLEDEQDVPLQAELHVADEACGDVGVGVDPRPRRQAFHVRRELGSESPHGVQPFAGASTFLSRTDIASAVRLATRLSRLCTSSLRGLRPFGDPIAYSQKIGNAIVESQ